MSWDIDSDGLKTGFKALGHMNDGDDLLLSQIAQQ